VSAPSGTTENLVIGGGLAGAMVGLRLAAAGREVTLLERERTAHHKVCGEFLSREAVELLEGAGVHLLELGAEVIRTIRLASKQRLVEAALPFTALSLSRCVLDEALLARAAQAGCRVQRGARGVPGAAGPRRGFRGLRDHRSGAADVRGRCASPGPSRSLGMMVATRLEAT